MNPEALDEYLSLGAVPAPSTIFQGIAQLRPAHYLVWENGGRPASRSTGTCRASPVGPLPRPRASGRFDEVFSEAVRLRLISDVPLGAFLSGGVDSTAVVEAMSRLSDAPRGARPASASPSGDSASCPTPAPWPTRSAPTTTR